MAAKKRKAHSKTATKKVAAKTVATKASANKPTIKKSPTKKVAAKKPVAKKTAGKNTVVKKAIATKRAPAKPRSKASSVDGILKQYQRERIAQESKLVSVRSEIKDLNAKIQSYQKQIVKLKALQLDTENSICTLDIRRDQEVAGLLSSLGINLDSIASAGELVNKKKVDKPTPLFDEDHSNEDKSDNSNLDTKSSEKPMTDILIAGKD